MTLDAAAFARLSADNLEGTYLERLEAAVAAVDEADLWWRPHPETTSLGTLLLHLEGNVRQWLLSGLGGATDRRDRAAEFRRARGRRDELLGALRATLREAAALIRTLDRDALARSYRIQGVRTTGLEAVCHVVEHLSWHAGQIVWLAKLRAGVRHGIAFHDDARLDQARNA